MDDSPHRRDGPMRTSTTPSYARKRSGDLISLLLARGASRWLRMLAGAVACVMGLAGASNAQMPGLPVLQNAFANSGVTVAGNYGHVSGSNVFGVAGAWGLGSGRFQISG